MYFWKMDALIEELQTGKFTQKQSLYYFLLPVLLGAVFGPETYDMEAELGISPYLTNWILMLVVMTGAVYCYWQNGGDRGRDFLNRYFAVGWVVLCRWFTYLILAGFTAGLIAGIFQLCMHNADSDFWLTMGTNVFVLGMQIHTGLVMGRIHRLDVLRGQTPAEEESV